MAININKGGKLGKYFYLEDDVEYGPVELAELLEHVNKDTLVYYEGITWTKAADVQELKRYFFKEEKVVEKIVEKVIEKKTSDENPPKRNYLVPILLLLILCGGAYWYNDYNRKLEQERLAEIQRAEEDSLRILNESLLAEEFKRKQDSIYYASSALLDSAKLIKLDIDYKLGIDKFKNLISDLFDELSSHSFKLEPFFADTISTFYENTQISKFELIEGLNNYYQQNNSLSENYQLIDSTCIYDSLEGNLGVYKFNMYYKTSNNSNQSIEKVELITAIVKINPDFKIVYYNWIDRRLIDPSTLNY